MTIISNLPPGWRKARLGDVLLPATTRNPKRAGEGEFQYVDIDALDNQTQRISSPKRLKNHEAPSRARVELQRGDVLFSLVRPYLRNVALVPDELHGQVASTAFCCLRPGPDVDSRYLFYHLLQDSFIHSVPTYGNSPPAARDDEFLSMEIVLPPSKDDQQFIAAKLDELLSELDTGVATLERARVNLRRYRASVLKSAVEGRVTVEWRKKHPSTATGAQLLERALKEHRSNWDTNQLGKFAKRGKAPPNAWQNNYVEPVRPEPSSLSKLPERWCWTSIGTIAQCLDSLRVPINKKERAGRVGVIPYYGANGQVGWIDDFLFDEPLVLVVEDETFTGREQDFSYLIRGKSWVNNHAHVLRATAATTPEFLHFALARYPFIPLTTGTTGRRKLTQQALMEAPVALPPLDEQNAIVLFIESAIDDLARVARDIDRHIERGRMLRQAILAFAFCGHLSAISPQQERDRHVA